LPIVQDDAVVATVSFLRDITERRKVSQALAQVQREESLGRLAGGIAHDLNNLLIGIMGNVQLARDEGSATVRNELLGHVTLAAERIAEHTERLVRG